MSVLARFLREKRHVKGLLAPADYRRWRWQLLRSLPTVLTARSLGVVDERLGEQLKFRAPDGRQLEMRGASFGVVREIFGQHCYADPDDLRSARHILDLGGNAGVFTLYALTCAPEARVHTVEAQPAFAPIIAANVERNGAAERSSVENALVGGAWNDWAKSLRARHPQVGDFSIRDYLARVGTCDFMKCDVEGAEFELFRGDLRWLGSVRRLALEYHGDWAAGASLRERIDAAGFSTRQAAHGSLGYIFGQQS